ncbi:MAG TPA: hypothetical protein VGU20_26025 [Stellaceae bacterium]|nr:hypothetical protein [Stellaceae bacterium]
MDEQGFRKIFAAEFRKSRDENGFRKIIEVDFRKSGSASDETAALPHWSRLNELADAVCIADPTMTKQTAMQWLLHTQHGRALIQVHKNEETMSRTEQLQSLAKNFGVVKIAKFVVSEGNGTTGMAFTEVEFTKMVHDHAQADRRSGETPAQAFARCFNADTADGVAIRKAHAVIKNFPAMMVTKPTQVGGAAATDVDNATDALEQLQRLAEEQRRRSPELTIEQAFARVYAATENAELANAERLQNRPRATTVYPGA